MKTTLPNLSYTPTGVLWSDVNDSAEYTKERPYPWTDLTHFIAWDTFETEIHQAITTRMAVMSIASDTEYDIGSMPKKRKIVSNEEAVRSQAEVQLHDLVEEVLGVLGIEGRFERPVTGDNQIIGEPDFSWLRNPTLHPKLVTEYRTRWVAPLEDLPGYFQRNNRDNVLERQSIDATLQLYGYMTFNENKYGVLSNMEHAWFFQSVETADQEGKTLQYYGPINLDADSVHSPSMLKAFVGIILLTEIASTWFHASLTTSKAPPGRYFGMSLTAIRNRDTAVARAQSYHATVVAGSYKILPLDPCLCRFNRTSVRHAPGRGCTSRATLARGVLAGDNLDVFCKIVDLFQREDSINRLDTEACNYAALQNLQGIVIPRVRGYFDVWGLLRFLALEDVGSAIPEDTPINTQTRLKMKSALVRIHSAGYVHGDIARRNFCMKAGMVFMVDLETLAVGNAVEMEAELANVDAL